MKLFVLICRNYLFMYDAANGFYVDWILSELCSIGGLIFHSLPIARGIAVLMSKLNISVAFKRRCSECAL